MPHENPAPPPIARRRRPDRYGRSPADERQGSHGLRGALRRRTRAAPRSTRRRRSAASARRWTTPRTARSRTRARPAPWPRARSSAAQAQEAAWQSAEVDALYRLAAAGVRVPTPYNFHDGVLLMELVTDADGDAAPRLNDVAFTPDEARAHHAMLLVQVVRMLCAGVVHGDLSEFNVLLGEDGPVIIDLPQAVDAAGNNHAQRMLLRDVANLRDFFGRLRARAAAHRLRPGDLGSVPARRAHARDGADRPLRAQARRGRPGRRAARDRRRAGRGIGAPRADASRRMRSAVKLSN